MLASDGPFTGLVTPSTGIRWEYRQTVFSWGTGGVGVGTSIGVGITFHPHPQTLRGQERINSKELPRTHESTPPIPAHLSSGLGVFLWAFHFLWACSVYMDTRGRLSPQGSQGIQWEGPWWHGLPTHIPTCDCPRDGGPGLSCHPSVQRPVVLRKNSLNSYSSWEDLTQGTQVDPMRPGASGTVPGSQGAVILRVTLSS